jgi:hypothetical protein
MEWAPTSSQESLRGFVLPFNVTSSANVEDQFMDYQRNNEIFNNRDIQSSQESIKEIVDVFVPDNSTMLEDSILNEVEDWTKKCKFNITACKNCTKSGFKNLSMHLNRNPLCNEKYSLEELCTLKSSIQSQRKNSAKLQCRACGKKKLTSFAYHFKNNPDYKKKSDAQAASR